VAKVRLPAVLVIVLTAGLGLANAAPASAGAAPTGLPARAGAAVLPAGVGPT
jgi:hypothetical protein